MNETLNQKIFNSDKIDPEVREKLLEISDLFLKTVCENSQICINPVDIVIVGSNASYNYSENSDLDLHIVVNFETIPANPDELIQSYYNAEKSNFNDKYDFKIYGINVEVYVEDVKANTVSNGIYSVLYDYWVKYPAKLDDKSSEINLEPELSEWMSQINKALSYSSKDSDVNPDSLGNIVSLIDKLYLERKYSLSVEGEYGKGNLIFKKIRSQGLLDKLRDRLYELQSDELSLESVIVSN